MTAVVPVPGAAGPAPGRDGHAAAARIGPNAILQTLAALRDRVGESEARRLFEACGLGHHAEHPPAQMVPEDDVRRLFAGLDARLGATAADAIQRDAGLRTARYLLAHRIPGPAAAILRWLPAPVAARLLFRAIARHAWTFAGSGRFDWRPVPGGVHIRIGACPLCRGTVAAGPWCAFYAGTFEGLGRALLAPAATAREVRCLARGDAACEFALAWAPGGAPSRAWE